MEKAEFEHSAPRNPQSELALLDRGSPLGESCVRLRAVFMNECSFPLCEKTDQILWFHAAEPDEEAVFMRCCP